MLLDNLRTRRELLLPFPEVRYDPKRQVSLVHENGTWIDSWLSEQLLETKKADVETGEDNKGE